MPGQQLIMHKITKITGRNSFEIELKYHRRTVVLLTAHILSLQDVLRGMFFSYIY